MLTSATEYTYKSYVNVHNYIIVVDLMLWARSVKGDQPKCYMMMVVPALLYRCETWAISQSDKNSIQLTKMKFIPSLLFVAQPFHSSTPRSQQILYYFLVPAVGNFSQLHISKDENKTNAKYICFHFTKRDCVHTCLLYTSRCV